MRKDMLIGLVLFLIIFALGRVLVASAITNYPLECDCNSQPPKCNIGTTWWLVDKCYGGSCSLSSYQTAANVLCQWCGYDLASAYTQGHTENIGTVYLYEGGTYSTCSACDVYLTSVSCCVDADDDGYMDKACGGNDCDDTNPAINPGATEVCNGVDDDCDDVVDEGGVCFCHAFTLDARSNTGLGGSCSGGFISLGNFPAGTYTIEYVFGAVNTKESDFNWNRYVPGFCYGRNDPPGCFVGQIKYGGGCDILVGFTTSGWATADAADIANAGTKQSIVHSGGEISIRYADDVPSDNSGEINYIIYSGTQKPTEVCNDGIDNDCDGEVDEGCDCCMFTDRCEVRDNAADCITEPNYENHWYDSECSTIAGCKQGCCFYHNVEEGNAGTCSQMIATACTLRDGSFVEASTCPGLDMCNQRYGCCEWKEGEETLQTVNEKTECNNLKGTFFEGELCNPICISRPLRDTLENRAICCRGTDFNNPCKYNDCVYADNGEVITDNIYMDPGTVIPYCGLYGCSYNQKCVCGLV